MSHETEAEDIFKSVDWRDSTEVCFEFFDIAIQYYSSTVSLIVDTLVMQAKLYFVRKSLCSMLLTNTWSTTISFSRTRLVSKQH